MSTSKNKGLLFIIAVLLLTNMAVLGYFLWFKKSPARAGGPGSERSRGIENGLLNEVGFNDQQISQYKLYREEQWNALKPMFEDMRKAKESFFRLISTEGVSDSVVNAITDDIAEKQKALDMRMYNHFKRIRALCTPEQLPKYDSLVQRMMRKMGKPFRKDQDKKEERK
jgi:Spy/CpxP family protein refolding chaperone